MISIIVPAHNESEVIERCLSALTQDSHPGELEVIVVCNGCTDDTADVARNFGYPVKVIESDIPSKANALNLGDRAAHGFPRFYVDADVVLSLESVRHIALWLEEGRSLVAAPTIQLDLKKCSWFVKAFYEIDCLMPSHLEGIGGSGVYALTETGRNRFVNFPRITADDGFIRLSFTRKEKGAVQDAYSIVTPPQNLSGLIKIKTRSHFGNIELRERFPQLFDHTRPANHAALLKLARRPLLWPRLAVYVYVKILARLHARRRMKLGIHNEWERDDSSRHSVAHSHRHMQVN